MELDDEQLVMRRDMEAGGGETSPLISKNKNKDAFEEEEDIELQIEQQVVEVEKELDYVKRVRNRIDWVQPPSLRLHMMVLLLFVSTVLCMFVKTIYCHICKETEFMALIIANMALSFIALFIAAFLLDDIYLYRVKSIYIHYINPRGSIIKMPPSLDYIAGILFMVVAMLFRCFSFIYASDAKWLVEYDVALVSICFMFLLGFINDILHLPSTVNFLLRLSAILPVLVAYSRLTTVDVPKPLIQYVGQEVLELGYIYKVYLGILVFFCSNSIKFHSGINDLEVGQMAVIAFFILMHNVMQIETSMDTEWNQAHALCIYFVLPLFCITVGLYMCDWFRPSIFSVGDTYTYLAGMTLAVSCILSHFSGTLIIFFFPQLLNLLSSCLQIFVSIKRPRTGLPRFDPRTGQLIGTNDWTLVNILLRLFGPCSKRLLFCVLLLFQASSFSLFPNLPFMLLSHLLSQNINQTHVQQGWCCLFGLILWYLPSSFEQVTKFWSECKCESS